MTKIATCNVLNGIKGLIGLSFRLYQDARALCVVLAILILPCSADAQSKLGTVCLTCNSEEAEKATEFGAGWRRLINFAPLREVMPDLTLQLTAEFSAEARMSGGVSLSVIAYTNNNWVLVPVEEWNPSSGWQQPKTSLLKQYSGIPLTLRANLEPFRSIRDNDFLHVAVVVDAGDNSNSDVVVIRDFRAGFGSLHSNDLAATAPSAYWHNSTEVCVFGRRCTIEGGKSSYKQNVITESGVRIPQALVIEPSERREGKMVGQWTLRNLPSERPIDLSKVIDWVPLLGMQGSVTASQTTVGIINGAPYPRWAADRPCGPIKAAAIPEFAKFAAALSERFDGDGDQDVPGLTQPLHSWEILNEADAMPALASIVPYNTVECWGENPELYAELLRSVSASIRRTNPLAKIVMTGMGLCKTGTALCQGFQGSQGSSVFNPDFFSRFLKVPGVARSFDVASVHAYSVETEDYSDTAADPILAKAKRMIEEMAREGIVKPIFVGEAGLCEGQPLASVSADEFQQALEVQRMAVRAYSHPNIVGVTWWAISDSVLGRCGLFRGSYGQMTAKKAVQAHRLVQTFLRGTTRAIPLTDTGKRNDDEGYVFEDSAGAWNKYAWWSNRSSGIGYAAVVGRAIYVTTFNSAPVLILDGSPLDLDGTVNGEIRITTDSRPKLIEVRSQTPKRVEAEYGFVLGAFRGDGVALEVRDQGGFSQAPSLLEVHKKYSGQREARIVNLTSRTIAAPLEVTVRAGASGNEDWFLIHRLKVFSANHPAGFDFIQKAARMTWSNSYRSCNFGKCSGIDSDGAVFSYYGGEVVGEDGTTVGRSLYVHPNWNQPLGFMKGRAFD